MNITEYQNLKYTSIDFLYKENNLMKAIAHKKDMKKQHK